MTSDLFGKVVGDLQRSGMKRSRLESPGLGRIKHYKCMVNLRDFPLTVYEVWFGNIMNPEWIGLEEDPLLSFPFFGKQIAYFQGYWDVLLVLVS